MTNEEKDRLINIQELLILEMDAKSDLQRRRIEQLEARIADLESQMIEPENV